MKYSEDTERRRNEMASEEQTVKNIIEDAPIGLLAKHLKNIATEMNRLRDSNDYSADEVTGLMVEAIMNTGEIESFIIYTQEEIDRRNSRLEYISEKINELPLTDWFKGEVFSFIYDYKCKDGEPNKFKD